MYIMQRCLYINDLSKFSDLFDLKSTSAFIFIYKQTDSGSVSSVGKFLGNKQRKLRQMKKFSDDLLRPFREESFH